MVLQVNRPSSSLHILLPISSSNHIHKNLKPIQLTNKSHISLSVSHCFNPLQPPPPNTTTTHIKIHKEEEEEEEEEEVLEFIRHKKLLSEVSSWGIGGPCNYFVQVSNNTQLLSVLRYCHEHSIRFLVIGKGSNCLFDDYGFDGCVILNRIEYIERMKPGVYRVGSGYPFNRLGVQCSNEGFTGLEFAGGIPGTVGGAIYMNAGANGQEIADVIDSVEIFKKDGTRRILKRSDLTFGYRTSSFQDMEDLAAVISVTFYLTHSDLARNQQRALLTRRKLSQPVGERCAGSVFQNPPGMGVSAGKLIEKAGLKGFRVGGAKVSEIHGNFFINSGNSTSKDMLELINFVKEKVELQFGIQLKEEIRYILPYHNMDLR